MKKSCQAKHHCQYRDTKIHSFRKGSLEEYISGFQGMDVYEGKCILEPTIGTCPLEEQKKNDNH